MMLMHSFFTRLFVSERKQIALMADEKLHPQLSHRLFATSRSEMRINMIRLAEIEDLESVLQITHDTISEIYSHYYAEGVVRFFLEHHSRENVLSDIENGIVWLLKEEGSVVGTVTIKENAINRLFVLPEYQSRGYGSQLMDFAEAKIAERFSHIHVDSSLAAKEMYLKRGYQEKKTCRIPADHGDILIYDEMEKRVDKQRESVINMSRQIRTSAKAVIIQNGKLLAIKLNDGKEEWYILPGGGQDDEEMLPQTVEREVREEAGIEVRCKELLFVIEGVHGESFHRIDLVFLCDYLGQAPNAALHCDTNQIGFDWLDLSILNRLPLFPSKLRRPIMNFYEGKEYIKYLGNEEVGDPECLE